MAKRVKITELSPGDLFLFDIRTSCPFEFIRMDEPFIVYRNPQSESRQILMNSMYELDYENDEGIRPIKDSPLVVYKLSPVVKLDIVSNSSIDDDDDNIEERVFQESF